MFLRREAKAAQELDEYISTLRVKSVSDQAPDKEPSISSHSQSLDKETKDVVRFLVENAQLPEKYEQIEEKQERVWQRIVDSPIHQYMAASGQRPIKKESKFLHKQGKLPSLLLYKTSFFKLGMSLMAIVAVGILLYSIFLTTDQNNGQSLTPARTETSLVPQTLTASNQPLLHFDSAVVSLGWSRDGKYLGVSTVSKIYLYDKAGSLLKTLNPGGEISKITWAPDSQSLAILTNEQPGQTPSTPNPTSTAQCKNCTVKVWTAKDDKISPLLVISNTILDLAWLPDSHHLLTLTADKGLRYWDLQGKLLINRLTGGESMALSPDGKELVTITEAGYANFWLVSNLLEGKKINEPPGAGLGLNYQNSQVTSLSWSADSQLLTIGQSNGKITFVKSFSEFLENNFEQVGVVTSLSRSPNGKSLATGSDKNRLYLWLFEGSTDKPELKLLKTYETQTGSVNLLAWSPDNTILAASMDAKSVVLLNTRSK